MSKKRNFDKKIIKPEEGIYIERLMVQVNEKNTALKCNEDTIIRTEIHGIISSKIREGKTKEDIIQELSKNNRYQNYSMYFENWITDKIKKFVKKGERQK